jgi:hypothetical protein
LLFIISGDITTLIDFASFLVWIFYGAAMVALILMRRTKKDVKRPYKVPCLIYEKLEDTLAHSTWDMGSDFMHMNIFSQTEGNQGRKW